jgi:predicted ABC-type transport system involved in lysophospholipase L1 biosynthesis ATPase subunit
VAALDAVSFGSDRGEFVAVMGPSGSGKTTLMNLLGLLDRPTSGQLTLAGEDVSRLSADRQAALRNRYIGFVFQSYNLLHRSTAIENVELPLIYAGVPRAERQRRVGHALERVGLSRRRDHWPAQLSGGEQQRGAIAREWPMAEGRYFSEQEQQTAAKVALIGRTVADQLFQKIRVSVSLCETLFCTEMWVKGSPRLAPPLSPTARSPVPPSVHWERAGIAAGR